MTQRASPDPQYPSMPLGVVKSQVQYSSDPMSSDTTVTVVDESRQKRQTPPPPGISEVSQKAGEYDIA